MQPDAIFLLAPQRWSILKEVARGHSSATALAKRLSLSVTYISQQLKLLEAAGYLQKQRALIGTVGKPRTDYALSRELIIVASLRDGEAFMKTIRPSPALPVSLLYAGTIDHRELYFLEKLYYLHEDLIMKMDALAFLGTQGTSINLLVITADLDLFRKQHSAITLTSSTGEERKFIIWSHTIKEIEDGIAKGESYFLEKVEAAIPLLERTPGLLSRCKDLLPLKTKKLK